VGEVASSNLVVPTIYFLLLLTVVGEVASPNLVAPTNFSWEGSASTCNWLATRSLSARPVDCQSASAATRKSIKVLIESGDQEPFLLLPSTKVVLEFSDICVRVDM
jgi:hypothetical protein